ncbi:hypothetical protein [Antribacter gilvus]|uniref:hypothetical protein n=1 Tax=Antribacter gilvus TaxID=2304675 RepID=UPI000F7917A9|nr:hypothetical protein [Antribacter gilvus]
MTARAARHVRGAVVLAATLAAAGVLAAGCVLAPGAAATADVPDGAVGLSVDGVTWTHRLEAELFDPSLRWVPGHTEDATLWVRNQSGLPATGWAEVILSGGGELPADLGVRTSIGDEPWTDGVRSRAVELAPGEVVPVRFEVRFDPGSGNDTQAEVVDLAVHVTLADRGVVPSPIGGPSPTGSAPPGEARPPSAHLPVTGAEVPLLLLAAGAAVAAGVLILLRRPHD